MKKIISILILLFFTSAFLVSSNPKWLKQLANAKYSTTNPLLRAEKYRYGDLFGITYLSKFKILKTNYQPRKVSSQSKPIRMFALGDSYIANLISANNFIGVDTLLFSNWKDSSQSLHLDKSKSNILIIETTERTFLSKFGNRATLKFPFENKSNKISKEHSVGVLDNIFNKDLNDNLEFTLFDNPLFTYVKQLRADINYQLFNSLPSTVVISGDQNNLFLKSTVDSNFYMVNESSSFKSIPDSLFNICINNCNYIYRFYKNAGFAAIYFSIIPNPVSVIGFPGFTYNNLLEKIESTTLREFKTINLFPEFLRNRNLVYLKSDTHWGPEGLQMWIDNVNVRLCKDGFTDSTFQ